MAHGTHRTVILTVDVHLLEMFNDRMPEDSFAYANEHPVCSDRLSIPSHLSYNGIAKNRNAKGASEACWAHELLRSSCYF